MCIVGDLFIIVHRVVQSKLVRVMKVRLFSRHVQYLTPIIVNRSAE